MMTNVRVVDGFSLKWIIITLEFRIGLNVILI